MDSGYCLSAGLLLILILTLAHYARFRCAIMARIRVLHVALAEAAAELRGAGR